MLVAKDFVILRGVTANSRNIIPVEREPVRVATLVNEKAFNEDHEMAHHQTVFFEDRIHDWDWADGKLRYYARNDEFQDILVVFVEEEVAPVLRFCPETGKPLAVPGKAA